MLNYQINCFNVLLFTDCSITKWNKLRAGQDEIVDVLRDWTTVCWTLQKEQLEQVAFGLTTTVVMPLYQKTYKRKKLKFRSHCDLFTYNQHLFIIYSH